MGKKNKKSNKTLDLQVPVANEQTAEQEDINLVQSKKSKKILEDSEITDSHNADNVNTKKKKRKHASADVASDTSGEPAVEERLQAVTNEQDNATTLETKKKKKKRHQSTQEESEIDKIIIENVSTDINSDGADIQKKKKKKNKGNTLIEEEIKHDIDQVKEEPLENETKISKKKKQKNNLMNSDSAEKSIDNDVAKQKSKVTRSQKKKKTGTAVLNAEESQVTEEDIDRFCEELDEEDNKQYEDWVKLIEASLPPPRQNT